MLLLCAGCHGDREESSSAGRAAGYAGGGERAAEGSEGAQV